MKKEKILSPGFLNIDKPSGLGSTEVAAYAKRLSGRPCGHMGTLDPLASGVLPVGLGNATRLFDYFLAKTKVYEAEFTFGVTSDTLDVTGELIPCGFIPTEEQIVAVLPLFEGEIMQIPPRYSAKNIGGRRGYELARNGIDFELPPKQVRIDSLKLTGRKDENTFCFTVVCGGGTYIRSLARDVAEKIGTFAVMSGLRRTQSGYFKIEDAVPFAELTEENAAAHVIPTECVLPFPVLTLNGGRAYRIFYGVPAETDAADGLYKIYRDGEFYGVAEAKNRFARIKTKLC